MLARELSPRDWSRIPPHQAALVWLITFADRNLASKYVESHGLDLNYWPVENSSGRPLLRVALSDEVSYPPHVLEVPTDVMMLRTAIRAAHWDSAGTLLIDGWAYVTPLDSRAFPADVTVTLVGPRRTRIPLPVEPRVDERINVVAQSMANDYSSGAWRARLDAKELERAGLTRADFVIEVSCSNDAGTWSEVVRDANRWGSLGQLRPYYTPSGARIGLIAVNSKRLHVQIRHHPLHVVAVVANGEGFDIGARSESPDLAIVGLRVTGNRDHDAHVFEVQQVGWGYRFHIPLRLLADAESVSWGMRAVDEMGGIHEINWDPNNESWPVIDEDTGISAVQTTYGNIALERCTYGLVVDVARPVGNTLILHGRIGRGGKCHAVVVSDHRCTVEAPVEWSDGAWTARVRLEAERWGRSMRPLPVGKYRVQARTGDGDLRDIYVSEGAAAALPCESVDAGETSVRMELDPSTLRPHLIIQPPLASDERGRRHQRSLQLLQASPKRQLRADTVLFRSFYGENTSCNNLGVFEELARRDIGLDLVWTIKDRSISVPRGGRAVIAGSAEWHELLGSAKYIFDNVHQPDFFEKHSEQVLVQTLHGYPFKRAGLPYWEQSGYSEQRISSFLSRHDQWDYLLSPASYATPLLERDFPSRTAETLEIGYPRNDVFFADRAKELRERTREILGVHSGQKVILYAPTYRDYLARNEFSAEMVEFLDVHSMAHLLGPDYVLLVRGHAMNARLENRSKGEPGVIDVTDYPEISELCLAADAAILDYSSLRFDFALTGKPMLFLVPDLDKYRDESRGWLIPYEGTAPGPLVRTTDECVEIVQDLEGLGSATAAVRKSFIENYMELEDGHASARLVDAVFR